MKSTVSGCRIVYLSSTVLSLSFFFFFNDTATTEIYTLSLHDALPISVCGGCGRWNLAPVEERWEPVEEAERRFRDARLRAQDRKSTRLNSSHANISYAVFCLKKKKKTQPHHADRVTVKQYRTM